MASESDDIFTLFPFTDKQRQSVVANGHRIECMDNNSTQCQNPVTHVVLRGEDYFSLLCHMHAKQFLDHMTRFPDDDDKTYTIK